MFLSFEFWKFGFKNGIFLCGILENKSPKRDKKYASAWSILFILLRTFILMKVTFKKHTFYLKKVFQKPEHKKLGKKSQQGMKTCFFAKNAFSVPMQGLFHFGSKFNFIKCKKIWTAPPGKKSGNEKNLFVPWDKKKIFLSQGTERIFSVPLFLPGGAVRIFSCQREGF